MKCNDKNASVRGLMHTRRFGTQYCNKRLFCQNIVVTFQNLLKYVNRNKYFKFTQEKNIGWKMYFYLFYRNIVLSKYRVPKCLVWIEPKQDVYVNAKFDLNSSMVRYFNSDYKNFMWFHLM